MTTDDPILHTAEWKATREFILGRDAGVCQIRTPGVCTTVATCVDHIVDRADGGPVFDPRNLRAACKPCNSSRSMRRTNAKRRRYRDTVADYEIRL